MSKYVDPRSFASAVVSGNQIESNDPVEISQKALELYLTAMAVAVEHNKQLPEKQKSKEKVVRNQEAINLLLGR